MNHEWRSERRVRVRVTDPEGATRTENFTISIEDVNEAPEFTKQSYGKANKPIVLNSLQVGDSVVAVDATDPDESDVLTYSLASNPEGLFAIDSSTAKYLLHKTRFWRRQVGIRLMSWCRTMVHHRYPMLALYS